MTFSKLAAVLIAALTFLTPAADAQEQPGWRSNCISQSRDGAPVCSMEQILRMAETRQLLLKILIKMSPDAKNTSMMIQLPHGIYLPAGVRLQVDAAEPSSLSVQTCDAKGCYIGLPVSDQLLNEMRAGDELHLQFLDLKRESITIKASLAGFAEAYDRIR